MASSLHNYVQVLVTDSVRDGMCVGVAYSSSYTPGNTYLRVQSYLGQFSRSTHHWIRTNTNVRYALQVQFLGKTRQSHQVDFLLKVKHMLQVMGSCIANTIDLILKFGGCMDYTDVCVIDYIPRKPQIQDDQNSLNTVFLICHCCY